MGTHVWGAGGSRRGRRISMDNPLISPWMQNTSGNIATNNSLRNRAPPTLAGVTTPAALYQVSEWHPYSIFRLRQVKDWSLNVWDFTLDQYEIFQG